MVRDRMPEAPEAAGHQCRLRTLNGAEYAVALHGKLAEEFCERVQSAPS